MPPRRYDVAMIGYASLRVFEPVEALPPEERAHLEAVATRPAGNVRRAYRHLGGSEDRLGLLEATGGGVEVRVEGEQRYACPPRTRIRTLTAMLSLRETVAPEVAEALVPEADARRAARELARMRRDDPRAAPSTLESPWQVPLPWFVLFEDSERRMSDRPQGGYRITYWTPVGRARQRLQRAVGILRGGDLEPVAETVGQLDGWLACFHAGSRVELDYGGAVAQLGWNELDEDHSAGDVQEALSALERGDAERAGELYRTVAGRWAEAKIRESLN